MLRLPQDYFFLSYVIPVKLARLFHPHFIDEETETQKINHTLHCWPELGLLLCRDWVGVLSEARVPLSLNSQIIIATFCGLLNKWLKQPKKVGSITTSIWQTRKLRHRDVKNLGGGEEEFWPRPQSSPVPSADSRDIKCQMKVKMVPKWKQWEESGNALMASSHHWVDTHYLHLRAIKLPIIFP